MSEHADDNLRAIHQNDAADAASRDETTWALQVQRMEADVAMAEAHVARDLTKVRAWEAFTVLIQVATFGLFVLVVLAVVQAVRGWR